MSKIPAAIGPYATYREAGDLVFVSGQLPVNGMTGEIEATEIKGQTKQVMENIQLILNELGANFDQIVKTTCFLTDLGGFVSFNEVYGEYFKGDYPARSAFQVCALPKGALVEIEFVVKK